MTTPSRIVFLTPSGRRPYLDLLKHYVLRDPGVDEWQLWDNCRDPKDRAWIDELAGANKKVRVVRRDGVDGLPRSINQFYADCTAHDTFYVKLDDDIVFLPGGFARAFAAKAAAERARFLWWSPLVVNNAICSWLLKYHSALDIKAGLVASAACQHGWASPYFAEAIHRAFLDAQRQDKADVFACPDAVVETARFSINCIGFFGSDVADLKGNFCPPGVDEEEWISAALPSILQRPGRIVGDLTVAHYSYFPQENYLKATDILDQYYALAGLSRTHAVPGPNPQKKRRPLHDWWQRTFPRNRTARRYPIRFSEERHSIAERLTESLGDSAPKRGYE
jgi:hypothetical protein